MKKPILFIALLCALLIKFSHAGIGENFEPAGIQIAGSGSFAFTSFDIEKSEYMLGGSLYPTFGIMTIRNLDVSFIVGYGFDYDSEFDIYSNNINCGLGLKYYFVKNPDENRGLVNSLGFFLTGLFNFKTDDDNYYGFSAMPVYTMYLFITERIAPYWGLYPSIGILDVNNPSLYMNLNVSFGISFHFPRKMRVTHPIKE